MKHRTPNSIITADRIRMEPQRLLLAERESTDSPQITVHRDGPIVRSIEINCPCGSHVVLDCQYDEGEPGTEESGPGGK